jgi:hypothetical protein
MKVGDLVKFVGVANVYKGRIGVVCRLYSTHGIRKNNRPALPDSALVYFAGLESAGRAASTPSDRRQPRKSGLHPMALDELEAIE